MELRRLTHRGIERMERYLDSQTLPEPQPYPKEILQNSRTSRPVSSRVELAPREFGSRLELAEHLDGLFARAGIQEEGRSRGLWSWLALYYFPVLCPRSGPARYRPGQRARWILAITDFQSTCRHLLAGPYLIYQNYREDPARALALLCDPPGEPSRVVHALASRQELVSNRGVIGAATDLYVDPRTKQPKKGAEGSGPGSATRFVRILDQLSLTWDLHSMSPREILSLLPAEFEHYKPRKMQARGI